jgi:hypothetical protein
MKKITFIFIIVLLPQIAFAMAKQKPPEPTLYRVKEPNLPRSDDLKIVIATHGWIEYERWPEELATAIRNKVDANEWLCGWFDWRSEAKVINPRDAAQYARDKAGPMLAKQILKLSKNPKHVHLIGHSAGAWVISEAAKIIAKETQAYIHLTFLDAYVPLEWDANSLGNIATEPNRLYWADHYLTEDITLEVTYCVLKYAHNIDIGDITPGLKDHRFPFHWYIATVLGKYPAKDKYGGKQLYYTSGDTEYGFTRSLEAGTKNWEQSLKLPMGNVPVKLEKPKEP